VRILVVDDDLLIVSYLTRELSVLGHDAVGYGSGAQALAAASRGEFDLMITDLMMPGLNGLQTIRAIRNLDSRLPVIVLSSLARGDWEPKARAAGAACYLQKPVKLTDLTHEIELVETSRFKLDIAIVDDDAWHAKQMEKSLRALGCQVATFDGAQQLEAGGESFTLLVVGGTTEGVERAIGWGRDRGIPVVAFGDASDDDRLLRSGASLFLEKPVAGRDLVTQARFLLS